MKVVEPIVTESARHCCVCAVICHHIGPIRLCSDHKPTENQKETR